MFNTFNMGVGMTVVVSKDEADKALERPESRRGAARPSGRRSSRAMRVLSYGKDQDRRA